ncbi:MAG: hypothetical protein ACTH1V_07710, partial [Alkalibacterium gilvum]
IKRVEIAFPVLDTSLKNHIISILTLYLYDNVKAWTLNNKGLYTKLKPGGDKPVHAQKELMQL